MILIDNLRNLPIIGSEWRRVEAAKKEADRRAAATLGDNWCMADIYGLIRHDKAREQALQEILNNRPAPKSGRELKRK